MSAFHLGTIPARKAFSITPADSDLALEARALYVGGAGDVAVRMTDDDSDVTFSGVAAGTVLPISVKRVNSTNTTATNILGLT